MLLTLCGSHIVLPSHDNDAGLSQPVGKPSTKRISILSVELVRIGRVVGDRWSAGEAVDAGI